MAAAQAGAWAFDGLTTLGRALVRSALGDLYGGDLVATAGHVLTVWGRAPACQQRWVLAPASPEDAGALEVGRAGPVLAACAFDLTRHALERRARLAHAGDLEAAVVASVAEAAAALVPGVGPEVRPADAGGAA